MPRFTAASAIAGALALGGQAVAAPKLEAQVHHDPNNLISGRAPQESESASSKAAPLFSNDGNFETLKPLPLGYAAGNKRDGQQGCFQLHKEDYLYWGSHDGTVAELWIDLPGTNEAIVDTELFDDLVESFECPRENEKGQLKLNFVDNPDFTEAREVWQWVNEDDDNNFLLMVGVGDCGWNEDRILYRVTDLDYDKDTNMAILDAQYLSWHDALHSYEMDVGKPTGDSAMAGRFRERVKRHTADKRSVPGKHNKRIFDWVEDVVDNVVDGVSDVVDDVRDVIGDTKEFVDGVIDKVGDAVDNAGDILDTVVNELGEVLGVEITPDFIIPFGADLSEKSLTFRSHGVVFSATCQECTLDGAFDVEAKFRMENFEVQEGFIDVNTNGIDATAILLLELDGAATDAIEESIEFVKFSPQGIHIPGVVTIGPTVTLSLVGRINSIMAGVALTIGGHMNIGESTSRLDFLNEEGTTAEGWEPEFHPEPLEVDAYVEASATVALTPKIGLEISVLDTGFAAELVTQIPKLTASLRAEHSSTCGVCDQYMNGVSGDIILGADIAANIYNKIGGENNMIFRHVFWEGELDPFAEFCEPVGPQDQCDIDDEEGEGEDEEIEEGEDEEIEEGEGEGEEEHDDSLTEEELGDVLVNSTFPVHISGVGVPAGSVRVADK